MAYHGDMRPPLLIAAAILLCAASARALCKPGMVEIDGKYCIDKYEGALVEVTASGTSPWSPFYAPLATSTYRAISIKGVKPQGHISGARALAACVNASKRLCSAAEWLQACQGSAKQKYPYGNDYKLQTCNEHSHDDKYVSPLNRLHNGKPVYNGTTMNDPRINQLPGTLTLTGDHAQCVSPNGVYDMVGNLHEWTAERNGIRGVFRGGYYNEAEQHGSGCVYLTQAHAFDYYDYSTGFRCCAEPISAPAFEK